MRPPPAGAIRSRPERVYGLDWSGARDAGRRIWICEGIADGAGLRLTRLCRAEELPGSGREREQCLAALREWIRGLGPSALGFDFPFGLPSALGSETEWEELIVGLGRRFADAEEFRRWCLEAAAGRELKRLTDRLARTPFCPYNLRMFRQTYWGIAGLLGPLVESGAVAVVPTQPLRAGLPWLLETCPASTLKRLGLYRPYKGTGDEHRLARGRILQGLIAGAGLRPPSRPIRARILADPGGDALDSAIAAVATADALRHADFPRLDWQDIYAREAFVYS